MEETDVVLPEGRCKNRKNVATVNGLSGITVWRRKEGRQGSRMSCRPDGASDVRFPVDRYPVSADVEASTTLTHC
jgi:hypothetical protein